MSFSISDIKRRGNCTNNSIRNCFSYVKNDRYLTDNIRYALERYLNFKLRKRFNSKYYDKTFIAMIKELLERCCGKCEEDITYTDVKLNEKEILYQIKKAIYYGSATHLYFEKDESVNYSCENFRKDVLPPKRLPPEQELEKQDIINYFEEVVEL